MVITSPRGLLGRAGVRIVAFAIIVVALFSGCTSPGPRGEIPFGEWSGRGVLTYEHWKPAGDHAEAAKPESIHRDYPTSLAIRPGRLDGHDVIELEIFSDRGPLPDLGDKTHLRAALVKAKRVSDSTVLYRLVGVQLNPGPDESLEFDDHAPPLAASCIIMNDTTTLQIVYLDNFVDTFRFRGDHVEKSGVYFNTKEGLIHWAEQLSREE